MKKLAKKLEENRTASRCLTVADCVDRVKKNKRPTALIHVNKIFFSTSKFSTIIFLYLTAKWPDLIENDGRFSRYR